MSLATGTNVRSYGALDEAVTDDLLIPHINAARRELKQWVGATKYAEAEAAADDEDVRIDLIEAEAFLAYAYAIEFVGIRHVPEGFAVEGQIGDGQYKYLGRADIKKIQEAARDRAKTAAAPHKAASERFHLGTSAAAEETS